MRIAFFGPMCSGKTYCADYLVKNRGFTKVNFAYKLKKLAAEIFDVHTKDGHDRIVLQQLGQKMREIDPDVWVKLALKEVAFHEYANGTERFVFDDLRYMNEASALKEAGFTLVRVYVPENIRLQRIKDLYPNTPEDSASHSSELEWANIVPDLIIDSAYPDSPNQQIDNFLGKISPTFSERI
jgi:dephospho-CoA kinase